MEYLLTFEHFRKQLELKIFTNGKYDSRKWKSHPNLKKEISASSFDEYLELDEKIMALRFNVPIRPRCIVCGNKTSIHASSETGFRETCSRKCAANSPSTREKTKNTITSKYGSHFTQNSEWMEKFVQVQKDNNSYQKGLDTLEAKYGVRSIFGLNSVKNLIKETNIQKYGVQNPMQNDEVRQKMRRSTLEQHGAFFNPNKQLETMVTKYGANNALKVEKIKNRVIKTTIERYGSHFNPDKTKETIFERYGVSRVCDIPGVREKTQATFRETTYKRITTKLNDVVIPQFTKEEFINADIKYNWKCAKCSKIFASVLSNGTVPRCFSCYPINRTGLEIEIREFINERYGKKSEKNRSILGGKELDLFFPSESIAIEVNGVYWHSDEFKKPDYHQQKSLACLESNVRLIHIFEDEWRANKDKVVAILDTTFGANLRIFARQCKVMKIKNSDGNKFIEQHHLSGNCVGAKITYALIHDDKIISVMSFGKPRYNKKYEWEIFRYCTVSGISVVGGASKILRCFELEQNPISLLSYAALDYSYGNVYNKCGFHFMGVTPPSYFYVDTNGKKFKRLAATKTILNRLAGTSDLSEQEAAIKLKLLKIYNCGNMIFGKHY